jgi:phosphatidylserine decarboxylase
MKPYLFILCQYLVPQVLLSRLAGYIAEYRAPWFKNRLIHWFIGRYGVDMSIALEPNPNTYRHFNDFFTRALAMGQRPIDSNAKTIVCPADGCISQIGTIEYGRIFQAKGQDYSLVELLGGDTKYAQAFQNGCFATVYLSPKDYHRVHMPYGGTLERMLHVPGKLFSVNDITAANVPRLFARNERVVCLFSTDIGPMAVVLVGAMIVASIETCWAGLITPIKQKIRHWDYPTTNSKESDVIKLSKGEEMGRFKLGSTAIVLFGENAVRWRDTLHTHSPVKMGEAIGLS